MFARTRRPIASLSALIALGACGGPPELSVVEKRTVFDEEGTEFVEVVAQTEPGTEVILGTPYRTDADEREGSSDAQVAGEDGRVELRVRVPWRGSREGEPTVRASLTIDIEDDDNVFEQLDVPRQQTLLTTEHGSVRCSLGGCAVGFGNDGHIGVTAPASGNVTVGGVEVESGPIPAALYADLQLGAALADPSPPMSLPVQITGAGPEPLTGTLTLTQRQLFEHVFDQWEDARETLELPQDPDDGAILWVGGRGGPQDEDDLELVGESIPAGALRRVTAIHTDLRRGSCAYRSRSGRRRNRTLNFHDATVSIYDVRTGERLEQESFRAHADCDRATTGGSAAQGAWVDRETIREWLQGQL